MSLSIILPCYNPPQNWAENIVLQYGSLRERIDGTVELIIVSDGSNGRGVTEKDVQYLQDKISGLKFISYEVNRGKGYAIRYGAARASGDILIYTDIDFPYDKDSFINVYNALKNDSCDVAVGIKNSHYYEKVPFARRNISKALRFMIRIFLSMPITDTQCGIKGFNKKAKDLFLQTTIDRYLFDLEFIRNCFKSKLYRVTAIPVQLNEGVHFRRMNYAELMSESVNFLKLLMK